MGEFETFTFKLSPRMRGCFYEQTNLRGIPDAFPAYAGMFPIVESQKIRSISFPRVCGDVSNRQMDDLRVVLAFPAYAGMFPISALT